MSRRCPDPAGSPAWSTFASCARTATGCPIFTACTRPRPRSSRGGAARSDLAAARRRGPARALTELAPRGLAADPAAALGRRWRHEWPGFWERLSPLGRAPAAEREADLRLSEIDGFMDDPEPNEEGSWR